MADVFICFKTDDTPRVAPPREALLARGLTVFWSNDIPKGAKDYQEIIKRQIRQAGVVVVFWTKDSVTSHPVAQECAQAVKDGKLMQAILDDLDPIDFPMEANFKGQKTNLIGWTGDRQNLEWVALNAAIDAQVSPEYKRRLIEAEASLRAERGQAAADLAAETARAAGLAAEVARLANGQVADAAEKTRLEQAHAAALAGVAAQASHHARALAARPTRTPFWIKAALPLMGATGIALGVGVMMIFGEAPDPAALPATPPEDKKGTVPTTQKPTAALETPAASPGPPGMEFQDCWTGSGGTSSVVVVPKGTPAEGVKGLARGQVCAPRMVVVPSGKFLMGSSPEEIAKLTKEYGKEYEEYFKWEGPQREVTIGQAFAVGKFEVTFAEWDACVADGGCKYKPDDAWGRGPQPVMNVSYNDITQEYLPWLSKKTGQRYRLLTEAEWEYAARAGTTTRYFWGDAIGTGNANCAGCGSQWDNKQTARVGSFKANPFGLHDLHGNVWEWVEDCCWHENYSGAPSDGTAWTTSCNGTSRVLRGGSWLNYPRYFRAAYRNRDSPGFRIIGLGFRLSRTLFNS